MSQRYFLTAESTYEDLRQSLNAALAYPNSLGKSVFQTALYAPRDNFRRVLLAVDTAIPGYATVNAAIQPLLDSDAMEEIDEATYLAAVASATAGASDWNDITGKPSTFAPSAHAASHAAGGADALFDQDLNTTDNVTFNSISVEQSIYTGGDVTLGGGVDFTGATITGLSAWRLFYSNGSGVITELTLGSSGQALLSNGASAAPSWGSAGSNSASDLTTGTLAYARMADPTVTSPSQITASQNDYASFARGINRFTTNGAYNLTGMVAGNDGEVRVLCNTGTTAANTLTIKDESSSSTAANRFYVPWNGDCVIPAEGSVVVFYDGTSSRWRVV